MAIYSNISGVGASLVKSVDGISISRIRTINAALSSAFALLLDKPYGADSVAAYSVRRLSGKYSGPAMVIRRDSDDEILRVGFNLNNDINSSAIEIHCAGTTCYVTEWRDQSGFGNDATQSIEANQPTIYTGGALVKENGKVALNFNGDYLDTTSISSQSAFLTINTTSAPLNGGWLGLQLGTDMFGVSGSGGLFYRLSGANTFQSSLLNTGYYLNAYTISSSNSLNVYQSGTIATESPQSVGGVANFTRLMSREANRPAYGNAQEMIMYASDKSSVRTSIEENIGDYFTQNTPLLDTYSGAAAAYSLRLLSSSYSGPLVRVREDGNDTQADIYANVFGELDTVSLAAHCGSNNGFVVSWLDQSGNSNHVTQAGEPNQPKIYDGSAGVVVQSRYPAVDFNGAGDYLDNSVSIVSDYPFSLVDVATPDTVHQGVVSSIVNSGTSDESFANFYNSNDNNENQVWARNGTAFKDGPVMSAGQQDLNFLYWSSDTANGIYVNNGRGYFAGGPIAFPTVNNLAIGAFRDSTPGQYFNGKIQEVVWYPSDESTSRKGIQSNVSAFYGMLTSKLIDKYPGAAAAYSLRSLSEQYDGAVVTVRRDSDDAQKNIYTLSDGQLDTSGLEAFCGTSDGFVVRWFDQSFNFNNATQPADNSQPKIYDGTTGVVTENGKPAVEFDGSSNYIDAALSISADFTTLVVATTTDTSTNGKLVLDETNSKGFLYVNAGDFNWYDGSAVSKIADADTTQNLFYVSANATNSVVAIDGSDQSVTTINNSGFGSLRIGGRLGNSQFWTGNAQEFILYASDKRTDRTGIEDNINENYLIYQPALIAKSGLLADYSGAAAAYSLRQLSDRAVIAVKVRRDSDDEQAAIGFFRGDLDTVSLSNFCGTSDGFVVEWSDQSTNGNHATQPADNNQPKIYDGSTGVITENGKPAVEFDGTSSLLEFDLTTGVQSGGYWNAFHVMQSSDTTGILMSSRSLTHGWYMISQASTSTSTHAGMTTSTGALNQSDVYWKNGTQQISTLNRTNMTSAFFDGNQVLFNFIGATTSGNDFTDWQIGAYSSSGFEFGGVVQEIVIYQSDQSSNRTGIEDNIFSHYSPARLLDTYSGAAAAYSLRKLSILATNAVQVRRDSDDAVKYIGFVQDAFNGESLDTADLSAFCGSANGFVTEWVDQSGNSNHATQPAENNQPKIYDGTRGVVTENGKPAVQFDGSNDGYLLDTTGLDIGSLSSFTVGRMITISSNVMLALSGSTDNRRWYAPFVSGGNFNYGYADSSTAITTTQDTNQNLHTMIAGTTLNGVEAWKNGTSAGTDTRTTGATNALNGIGNLNSAFYANCNVQEVIFYGSDQSSNRTNIEDNINTFYEIY